VLHEGDAHPARNTTLIWKSVEPAEGLKVVLEIRAGTCELQIDIGEILRLAAALSLQRRVGIMDLAQ